MAAKLSRSSRRRVDSMVGHLEQGSLNLNKISTDTLEDLVGRAAISSVPDGYSTNTRLGDGSRGTADITSTEASVLAREKPRRDELNQRVKHIEKLIMFIDVAAHEIQSNIDEIYRQEEEKKQRVVSTPCLICDVNPSEKAGYCKACYDTWQHHGAPDRLMWELFKKQSTNVDGLLLVEKCPRPGPGRTARRGPWKNGAVAPDLTDND
jgi:hypothetical protein